MQRNKSVIYIGYDVTPKTDIAKVRQKWFDAGAPFFWKSEEPKNWSIETAKRQIKKH